FVDVPPRGTAKKTLGAVLPAGVVTGRVELTRDEAQGLDEDDGQDFVVHVPRDVKALIVDGAPSSLRSRDEAFFVEAALAPARTGGRIHAQTLDADAAANTPLDGYDVLLLLNVAAPPKAFADKLRQAVIQRGLGVFIALGDHVDADAYNEVFGEVLPRTLTDWPIRVSFLPVLQQSVSWLADALEQRQPGNAMVGEERTVSAPPGTRVEKILGSGGDAVPFRRETAHPDDAIVLLGAPGQYRALVAPPGVQPREEPTLAFVATLDPRESDLRRVDEA